MKIEIDQIDFREINDKLGGIRSAAVMARMTTEEEMITHLKNIVTWAQEITVRLNSGVMVPEAVILTMEKENKGLRGLVAEGVKVLTDSLKENEELLTEIQQLIGGGK